MYIENAAFRFENGTYTVNRFIEDGSVDPVARGTWIDPTTYEVVLKPHESINVSGAGTSVYQVTDSAENLLFNYRGLGESYLKPTTTSSGTTYASMIRSQYMNTTPLVIGPVPSTQSGQFSMTYTKMTPTSANVLTRSITDHVETVQNVANPVLTNESNAYQRIRVRIGEWVASVAENVFYLILDQFTPLNAAAMVFSAIIWIVQRGREHFDNQRTTILRSDTPGLPEDDVRHDGPEMYVTDEDLKNINENVVDDSLTVAELLN